VAWLGGWLNWVAITLNHKGSNDLRILDHDAGLFFTPIPKQLVPTHAQPLNTAHKFLKAAENFYLPDFHHRTTYEHIRSGMSFIALSHDDLSITGLISSQLIDSYHTSVQIYHLPHTNNHHAFFRPHQPYSEPKRGPARPSRTHGCSERHRDRAACM